jgi:hypothetical protein
MRSPVWAGAALALLLAVAARADDTPGANPPPTPHGETQPVTPVPAVGDAKPAAPAAEPEPAASSPPAGKTKPAEPAAETQPAVPPPANPQPAAPPAETPAASGQPVAEPPPAEPAANQIGRSIFVANDVDGRWGEAPPQRVAVNDDILFEEDITTGADSKAVIEFRDGSTFEVGPDAVVRIDSFVFNPEESVSEKSVQVTRGVFRYVSGYVASNQDTKIATPTGVLGIRGSVAAGIVDPEIPDFVYVGDGVATFTNQAGSAELQPGSAIAVPSPSTPPMAPAAMPPAVAAQALEVIEKRLPPRQVLQNRPPADEAWVRRTGAVNLVPAAVQRERMAAMARGRPLPNAGPRGALAGELGLLVEGNRVNFFAGRQTARTAEQAAFLTRAARERPNAAVTMRRFSSDARALHVASMNAGTGLVLRGIGRAARSDEVMRRVTAASVRANPGAAALINRHAAESFPRRENFGRPGERGGQNAHQPLEHREREGGNVRPNPLKPPVQQLKKPLPKPPPGKDVRKKKGEEQR